MADRQVVLEVEGLCKHYDIKDGATGKSRFGALHDVSFTLYKGDILGIVGSNGSGKSTLLKILGEVVRPSSGRAVFYGSAMSVLDLGDNFHPDLTGRENVDIRLKLAGIPKAQMETVRRQILAFSEIGDFFERPLKTYSNGMYLRLAFSVAIQLDADIFIFDEVLAVGDEGFRLKCRYMLAELAQKGKTILFVSHNHTEVQELSTRCLWLDKGKIKMLGRPTEVLGSYFTMHHDNFDGKKQVIEVDGQSETGTLHRTWPEDTAPGNEALRVLGLSITPASGGTHIYPADAVRIAFRVHKKKKGHKMGAFFFLQDVFYQSVMVGHSLNNLGGAADNLELQDESGIFDLACEIPPYFLMPGKYNLLIRFGLEEDEWSESSEEVFRFSETVSFRIHAPEGYRELVGDISKGAVRPPLRWQVRKV